MSNARTTVDIIRHGEPVGGRCYRGQGVDDSLSERGWSQMRQATTKPDNWQVVISSPMLRCSAFAKELAPSLNVPLVIDHNLIEIGLGVWEGLKPHAVELRWPEAYAGYYSDPISQRPGGAEPVADFYARVISAYRQIIMKYRGQHCLIVAHAGVVRALVAYALEGSLRGLFQVKVPYAGLTRLSEGQNGCELIFHAR